MQWNGERARLTLDEAVYWDVNGIHPLMSRAFTRSCPFFLFSSFLWWNSFLHITVLGFFCLFVFWLLFFVLLFCSQTNSPDTGEMISGFTSLTQLQSCEKSSTTPQGSTPVPEKLFDWPCLGHFPFIPVPITK